MIRFLVAVSEYLRIIDYRLCNEMPKNVTQVFHLTSTGSFSQFLRGPIHIASVFATLSFSPENFSKQSSNTSKVHAESKSDKTTVVSSANRSSLVSNTVYFYSFHIGLVSYSIR